jgi:hypothetical protein
VNEVNEESNSKGKNKSMSYRLDPGRPDKMVYTILIFLKIILEDSNFVVLFHFPLKD